MCDIFLRELLLRGIIVVYVMLLCFEDTACVMIGCVLLLRVYVWTYFIFILLCDLSTRIACYYSSCNFSLPCFVHASVLRHVSVLHIVVCSWLFVRFYLCIYI